MLIKTLIQGAIMGIVETVPSIGATTFALVVGIYDDIIFFFDDTANLVKTLLLFIIKKASKKDVHTAIKKLNIKFFIPLCIGVLIGLAVFSHIMTFLLDRFPAFVYAVFFGFTVGALTVPYKQMKKHTTEYLLFIASALVLFFLLGLKPVVLDGTPSTTHIGIGGILAVIAIFLPGVSVSSTLLMVGLYDYLIHTVRDLSSFVFNPDDIRNVFLLIAVMGVGFLLVVRLLKDILIQHRSKLMAVAAGLMLASLRIMWPFTDSYGVPQSLFIYPILHVAVVTLFSVVALLVFFIFKNRLSEEF